MKILIIQQKMIGDVLTTSSLFEVIKRQQPNTILHYVINKHTVPVIENNPFIDALKIITPEIDNSFFKLISFSKQLHQENYDVIIDVYSVYSSNIISLFCGANRKISKHKWYTSFIYTNTFKDEKETKTNAGLAIENRLKFLEPILNIKPKAIQPKIYLTPNEIKISKKLLTNFEIDLKKPLYMISVLGSNESKTYPFKYMAKIIDTIVIKKPEAQILFNYMPQQKNEAKEIFNLCQSKTQKKIYFNVFGKGLRSFLAITHFCNALIGNEGGAINMAKALGVPTFTIFSPWIKKEAWSLFEDDVQNVSVHLKDFKPQLFEGKSTKDLKANWKSLYKEFSPTYYIEKLQNFIK